MKKNNMDEKITTNISNLKINHWQVICQYLDKHDLEHLKINKFYHSLFFKKPINSEGQTLFNLVAQPKRNYNCKEKEITQLSIEGNARSVSAMVAINQQLLAVATYGTKIHLWDYKRRQRLRDLTGHKAVVTAFCVLSYPFALANQPRLVSGSENGEIKIWDVEKQRCLMSLQGHNRAINSLLMIPEVGLISISDDTKLKIWDPNTGQCKYTFNDLASSLSGVAYLNQGKLVTTSDDMKLKVWDLEKIKCLRSFDIGKIQKNTLHALSNHHIIFAGEYGRISIFDIEQEKYLYSINTNQIINNLSRLITGEIVVCFGNSDIQIYDDKNLQKKTGLALLFEQKALAPLPNGNLVSGSEYGFLTFFSFPQLMQHPRKAPLPTAEMDTSEDMNSNEMSDEVLYDEYLSRFT